MSFRSDAFTILAFSDFFGLDAFEQSFEIAFPEAIITVLSE